MTDVIIKIEKGILLEEEAWGAQDDYYDEYYDYGDEGWYEEDDDGGVYKKDTGINGNNKLGKWNGRVKKNDFKK